MTTITDTADHLSPYGALSEGATVLTLKRRLPGPVERVWEFLTDSDKRQQWLAAGDMTLKRGSTFELVWRNDDLSASPSERPEGFGEESSATCELQEVEPMRCLRFIWPGVGEVTFELAQMDGSDEEANSGDVMLTVTHRQLSSRQMVLLVGAGWHAHLDILSSRMRGKPAPSFWKHWQALKDQYEQRVPK